jgi:hypothetical protein
MFGSIAGAESILLSFDEDFAVDVAMAEAPPRHRAVAAGQGPGEPDGDDPRLRGRARAGGGQGASGCGQASRAIYEATLETTAGGVKTFDLGGQATTTEFTDAVVEKIRTKVEIWSSLGSSV